MKKSISIAFIGKDRLALTSIKKNMPKSKEISVESAELESVPGVIETLSVLGVIITVVGGVVSQVAGAWIYDFFKEKKGKKGIEVYVNGNPVTTRQEIYSVLAAMERKRKRKHGKKNKNHGKSGPM
jgi:hypothetical protein